MTGDPLLRFALGVLNAGLAVVDVVIAPVANPLWNRLAAIAVPPDHFDVFEEDESA